MIKVLNRQTGDLWEFQGSKCVRDILEALHLVEASVLVARDGELLTRDIRVADGETIECEGVGLSEEHGTIRFREGSEVRKSIRWGQKLEFVPNHCCTTVNQHDSIVVVKDSRVAAVWPVTARGKYY